MKKWMLNSIIGGSTFAVAAVALGVPLAIVTAKALQAKGALEKIASKGGPRVNLQKRMQEKNGLKVVALGDSITAGYNGFIGAYDHAQQLTGGPQIPMHNESYVDFLVQSLKNAEPGKNIEYKNYAKDGLRLTDIQNLIEEGQISRQLKDADLIPITIGSNDILQYINFLGMPFSSFQSIIANANDLNLTFNPKTGGTDFNGQATQNEIDSSGIFPRAVPKKYDINSDLIWSKTFAPFKTGSRTTEAGLNINKEDSKNILMNTLRSISDIADGSVGEYLTIDHDYQDKIFDMVKSGIMLLIKQLHDLAPNAQIMLLGPDLPFGQFPDSVLTSKNKYNENKTLGAEFNRLLDTMKQGAKFGLNRPSDFVDFFKADELPSMKPYSYLNLDNNGTATGKPKVKYDTEADFVKSIQNQPMPNITDIHPSIFGHSLIAKDLFSYYGKQLGLSANDITKDAQQSYAYDDTDKAHAQWLRKDEDPSVVNVSYESAKAMNGMLTSLSQTPKGSISGLINGIISQKIDGLNNDPTAKNLATIAEIQSKTKNVLTQVVDSLIPDSMKDPKTHQMPDSLKNLLEPILETLNQGAFKIKLAEIRVVNSKTLNETDVLKNSLMGTGSLFELITQTQKLLTSI